MCYIADCPETGDLRLVEGAAHYEGTLEIYFPDEGWGPICYSYTNTFSLLEADTACKQLGYLQATSTSTKCVSRGRNTLSFRPLFSPVMSV